MDSINEEGFVVRFEDGYRFKIKFQNYVHLHSLIFSVSSKSIWSSLKSGKEIPLDRVPDELFNWVKECKSDLIAQKESIEKKAQTFFLDLERMDRKSFAEKALETDFAPILFRMLDKKGYDDIIWKMIEPEYGTPRHEEV